MIVLVFGAPGSGKGTQARLISERRNIPAISTGDMLRAECRAGTTLGQAACAVVSNGGLLDDATMNALMAKRLQEADCRWGYILDGYPRTIEQAIALTRYLEAHSSAQPAIVHLDVPDKALVARLSSRRYCPSCGRTYNLLAQPPARPGECDDDAETLIHRTDDDENVVIARLKAYHKLTEPLIEYYQGPHYHRIDGDGTPAQISERIEAIIPAGAPAEDSIAISAMNG